MDANTLKVTTRLIYDELIRRGIEVQIISAEASLLRFKDGDKWRVLRSTLSDKENAIAFIIAKNKEMTADMCARLGIPHPSSIVIKKGENVSSFMNTYSPVVVKPIDGAHGHGVTLDVKGEDELWAAFDRTESQSAMVQQMVKGDDYRVLIIDGQYVAAIKRVPATVIGDGEHTIRWLIEEENKKPERGRNYTTGKEEIPLEIAERYLGDKIDTHVPRLGESVRVVDVPNLSAGGDAFDVTENVPSVMVEQSKMIAKELGFGICGADFVWDGEGMPYLIEINATPGIDMHDDPRYGQPRGAISAFVDYVLSA